MDFRQFGRQRFHESFLVFQKLSKQIGEVGLRLPGLILLELWWRKRDMTFDEMTESLLEKTQKWESYLDIETILDFVHRRNFDDSAAHILSYSVLLLSMTFLTVSMSSLLCLYLHAVCLLLFGCAHYMSATYVALEQKSTVQELNLDDFVKLERHGFHFLAQLMLSVVQSMILGLDTETGRVGLAVFTLPIVARMCNCPLDKLIVAHNVACCMSMLFICIYVLNRVPLIWEQFCQAWHSVWSLFATIGLVAGAAMIWRRQKFTLLLSWSWIFMFAIRMYIEIVEKDRSVTELGAALLAGIAETTNTPLTMLALALTVASACQWVQTAALVFLDINQAQQQHFLAHSGYMEGLTLLLLCTQTGLLGMRVEHKAFLLGLILFIVLSALLQALFEMMETQLQSLATSRTAPREKHLRCVCLGMYLVVIPISLAFLVTAFLPLDLWCSIIVSNCVLTCLHSISALVQYTISRTQLNAENWHRSDSLSFATLVLTKSTEIIVAVAVVAYGSFVTLVGEWTVASVAVLLLQVIVNVIQRIDALIDILQKQRAAEENLLRLPLATEQQIEQYSDVCAICLQEMLLEIRSTPCSHLFHSTCLRKWLAVKQVCPMCYCDMSEKKDKRGGSATSQQGEDVVGGLRITAERQARLREESEAERERLETLTIMLRGLDNPRDLWPLMRQLNEDSDVDDDEYYPAAFASSDSTDAEFSPGEYSD